MYILIQGVLSEIGTRLSAFSAANALNPRFKAKCPLAGKNTLGLRPRVFSAGLGAFSALNLGFRGIFCRKRLQARPISSTKHPGGSKMGHFLRAFSAENARFLSRNRAFSENARFLRAFSENARFLSAFSRKCPVVFTTRVCKLVRSYI